MQSDSYQEDIYPMTPGTEPALTPDEWLGGINRGTSADRRHRRAKGLQALPLPSSPGLLHDPLSRGPLPPTQPAQSNEAPSLYSPLCHMTLSPLPS